MELQNKCALAPEVNSALLTQAAKAGFLGERRLHRSRPALSAAEGRRSTHYDQTETALV